jgi:hypothetical protein
MRSASIGLGIFQALDEDAGIEGIDYLSTVSGGGYIGCSLAAALQQTDGRFPFTNFDNFGDTDSVRHIRDFSNYRHGALDAVTALGIYFRGLVANAIIILPILLFFVWITLLIHPTVESLDQPRFLFWDFRGLTDRLGLQNLHGYSFTAILAGVNIVFLIVWAFAKSISVSQLWQNEFARQRKPGYSAELRGGLVTVSKWLFFITVTMAWFETQPFILQAVVAGAHAPGSSALAAGQCTSWAFSGDCFGAVLRDWFKELTPALAAAGAVFAYVSKYLGDTVAAAAKHATGWQAWLKKFSAMAALWLAAIIVPVFLWFSYLWLTYLGISQPAFPYVPDWLSRSPTRRHRRSRGFPILCKA